MSASFLQLPRSKSAPEDKREQERLEKWYYKIFSRKKKITKQKDKTKM